jgi:hypothetical protein
MAAVQETAMCVLWFFETKSVIKRQRRYRTQYGKVPASDNAIRRWLKQFKETGCVLHRKGEGRPSTSQEDVDRIQEAFSRSPQKSTGRASLQLGIPQTAVSKVVHNCLQVIKLFKLYFHTVSAVLFIYLFIFGLKNIDHGNTDNNLHSPYIFEKNSI